GHRRKVLWVAIHPDGKRLLTSSADGSVRQWDLATGREVEAPFERHTGEVLTAAYSPDGNWIASGGTDRTVRVWGAKDRQEVAVLYGHTGVVREVAFTPDGRQVVSNSYSIASFGYAKSGDGTVRLWDVSPGAGLPWRTHLIAQGVTAQGLALPSTGAPGFLQVVVASRVALLDPPPLAGLPVLRDHTSYVYPVAYSPDGRWIASGSWDHTV